MIQNALLGVVIIAVLTQVFKAFLSAAGMDNTNRWQNPLIWLFMLVIGVGGYVLNARLDGPLTGGIVKNAAGLGFLAISAAIGQYSLVTHDYFQPSTSTQGASTTLQITTPAPIEQPPRITQVTNTPLAATLANPPTPFQPHPLPATAPSHVATPITDRDINGVPVQSTVSADGLVVQTPAQP